MMAAKVRREHRVPSIYLEAKKRGELIRSDCKGRVYQDRKEFLYPADKEDPGYNADRVWDLRPKWAILSIDGGGIKGVIPAYIVAQLEWILKEELKEWKSAASGESDYIEDRQLQLRRDFIDMVNNVGGNSLEILREVEPDKLKLADFFNLMAGTSTGSLIVGLLAHKDQSTQTNPNSEQEGKANKRKLLSSGEQAYGLYLTEGKVIFGSQAKESTSCFGFDACCGFQCCGLRKRYGWLTHLFRYRGYRAKPIEDILEDQCNYPPEDAVVPCLITIFDLSRNRPILFSTHHPIDRQFGLSANMRDICRASAAAPTVLPPKQMRSHDCSLGYFIDGAFVANNPIQHALQWAEARRTYTVPYGYLEPITTERTLVLSLGTGDSSVPPDYSGPLHPEKVESWGTAGWAVPAITAAMDGNSKAAHRAAASAFAVQDLMPAYVRLQPRLSKASLLHVSDAGNVDGLVEATKDYLTKQTFKEVVSSPPATKQEVLAFREDLRRSFRFDWKDSPSDQNGTDSPLDQSQPDSPLNQSHAERLIDFAVLLVKNWIVRKAAPHQLAEKIAEEYDKLEFEEFLGRFMSGGKTLAAEGIVWLHKRWNDICYPPDENKTRVRKKEVDEALSHVTSLDFSSPKMAEDQLSQIKLRRRPVPQQAGVNQAAQGGANQAAQAGKDRLSQRGTNPVPPTTPPKPLQPRVGKRPAQFSGRPSPDSLTRPAGQHNAAEETAKMWDLCDLQIPQTLEDVGKKLGALTHIDLGIKGQEDPRPKRGFQVPSWVNNEQLPSLTSLTASPCRFSIEETLLKSLSNLTALDISHCASLSSTQEIYDALPGLKALRLTDCIKLTEVSNFLELTLLDITGCKSFTGKLPQLPQLQTLLAAFSGLGEDLSNQEMEERTDLENLSISYGFDASFRLAKISGYMGRTLRKLVRLTLPVCHLPAEDYKFQTSLLPEIPRTQRVLLSLEVGPKASGKIQGLVVRCLMRDNSVFLRHYNSPVTLRVYLGDREINGPDDRSYREIYSRLENTLPESPEKSNKKEPKGSDKKRPVAPAQLHVLRFGEEDSLSALETGQRIELRATYYSPADVTILHADITIFDTLKLPLLKDCLRAARSLF